MLRKGVTTYVILHPRWRAGLKRVLTRKTGLNRAAEGNTVMQIHTFDGGQIFDFFE